MLAVLISRILNVLRAEEALLDWVVAFDAARHDVLKISSSSKGDDQWRGKAYNKICRITYERSADRAFEKVTLHAHWASFSLRGTFKNGRLICWSNRKEELPITVSENFQAVQFLFLVRSLFPMPEQVLRATGKEAS